MGDLGVPKEDEDHANDGHRHDSNRTERAITQNRHSAVNATFARHDDDNAENLREPSGAALTSLVASVPPQ